MQAGNVSGEDRKGDETPPEASKLALGACDVSSDDFTKTWLTLKDLHDKEIRCLQAKLTSLRKERLADRRTSSTAKIKELTEQQKVLSNTIQILPEQLRSKTCDRCSMSETYKSTLQQEFYDTQQRNLKCIAEITAERNKLRQENKMLSAKLKLNQQKFSRFSESSDDFIPCGQKPRSVFMLRNQEEENAIYQSMKLMEQSNSQEMKSGGKKEEEQPSPAFTLPLFSPNLIDTAETPCEKLASKTSKPSTGSAANPGSFRIFPSISSEHTQKGHEFEGVSDFSKDNLSQAIKKEMFLKKISPQRISTQMDFSWSFPGFPEEQNTLLEIIDETSEEKTPENRTSLHRFPAKEETLSPTTFPFIYTKKNKSLLGIPRYNIGFLGRDDSFQTSSNEQPTLRKNSDKSTGAAEYGAVKPPSDKQNSTLGSKKNKKAKTHSKKRQ